MAQRPKLPCSPAKLLVALLLSVLGCQPGAPTGHDNDLRSAIDSIATDALASGPVAGLSVAIAKTGELAYASGFGSADLEAGRNATRGTIYVAASVTKMLTAIAALTLVRDKQLALDETLADLLPDYPNPEQASSITLRHLLNHTSGLHDLLGSPVHDSLMQGKPIEADAVLDWLRDLPLDFAPGTHWTYSNTGYYLVGLIIERISGQSYGDFVREQIAEPLGLRDTFLCDDWLHGDRRTIGYEPSDSGFVRAAAYETTGTKTGFDAAGGFCSTAVDLAMLPTALSESALLPDSLFREMRMPTTLTTGATVDYGLGVRLGKLGGNALWGHSGGSASTWALVAHYDDQDMTVSIMMNTDRSSVDAWLLQGRIARSALGINKLPADTTGAPDLRRYTGTYVGGRGNRTYDVSAEEGRLLIRERGSDRGPTTALLIDSDRFVIGNSQVDEIAFDVREGHVLGYSVYWDGIFWNYRRVAD